MDDIVEGVEAVIPVDEGGHVLQTQGLEFCRRLGWVGGDDLRSEWKGFVVFIVRCRGL